MTNSSDENIDEEETNTSMDFTNQNYDNIQNPFSLPKVPGPIDVAQTLVEGPTQSKLKCYLYSLEAELKIIKV